MAFILWADSKPCLQSNKPIMVSNLSKMENDPIDRREAQLGNSKPNFYPKVVFIILEFGNISISCPAK